jgi:hypothetical protein
MWCTEKAESPRSGGDWQGEIEHIQSGRRRSFDTLDELLSLVRLLLEEPEAE